MQSPTPSRGKEWGWCDASLRARGTIHVVILLAFGEVPCDVSITQDHTPRLEFPSYFASFVLLVQAYRGRLRFRNLFESRVKP